MFGPARNGGEAYLVDAGFVGSGDVVVVKRTGGGTGLQVASNKDVPTRMTSMWV